MTRNEIKRKIAQLIGKNFQSFGEYITKEGTEMRIDGEKMEEGMPIYVITPEGQLPVSDGDYEMETGEVIKVEAGLIKKMEIADMLEEKVEEKVEEIKENFDEATLADGTIVGTDGDFEVGKKLYVKDEAGSWVQAPEGEHTTESGIVMVVDAEGTITGLRKPDSEGEGTLEDMMAEFSAVVNKLTEKINELQKEQKMMNEKFNKIASQPAGEKVFDRKGFLEDVKKEQFSKLEALAQLRKK